MDLGRGPSSKYRHSATPTFTMGTCDEWHTYIFGSMWAVPINPAELPCYMRLLHEGDLRRCFRDSGSVTYVSTLPAPSPFCVCLVPYVHLAVSALHLIFRAKSQHI